MNILSMTYEQTAAEMKNNFGKGAFHAKALYREIFKKGNRSFSTAPEFFASKVLAKKLADTVIIPSFKIVACRKNNGGVTKFATTLSDDNIIETVILPAHNRTTVCVSSQVGCAMGCTMCQTGSTGFIRNLSVEEIVAQIYTTRFEFNLHVDNIVFMGMGEPLDNFDNVFQAVRVLNDQRGLAISLRAITISTSGIIPGIEKLTAMNMPSLRFAISINAADNKLRSQLMPINKKYPLENLKKALLSLPLSRDGVIFVEYVLIAGINDSPEMAFKLVNYLQGLKVRVNVIAFNQSDSLPYTSPTPEQVQKFCNILVENHLFVRIRQSLGREICAACGQLRGLLTMD
jgi:23S rRNA (adenine2503-C2)-methyltransferase